MIPKLTSHGRLLGPLVHRVRKLQLQVVRTVILLGVHALLRAAGKHGFASPNTIKDDAIAVRANGHAH